MVRLLILGTGGMANTHAEAFAAIAGVEIVGGVDTRADTLTAFCVRHGVGRQFASVGEALAWGGFEAACNVTPDGAHFATTMPLLAAGKHVLCEKPLATNQADAMAMADAARAAGVVNMVNLTYRNGPALQKAAAMVAGGAIGAVRHFEASYLQSWLTQAAWGEWRDEAQWLWRLSSAHGSKGVLGDVGIHILDFMGFVAGQAVVDVSCRLATFDKAPGARIGDYTLDANDSATLQVRLEGGALGVVHASRMASGHLNDLRLRIYGDLGGLEVGFENGISRLRACVGDDLRTAVWRDVDCPDVATIYERFIAAIRGTGEADPDFARGAQLQRVLDRAMESADQGGLSLTVLGAGAGIVALGLPRVYQAKSEFSREKPMRRVVVTGLGMVTPLACGVEKTWERLLAGQSGAGPITRFDPSGVVTQYACEIPRGDGTDGTFNPDDWMEPKDQRKVDDFILYGMTAAVQAVRDSGWVPVTDVDRERTGVMIGSGIGGLSSISETALLIKEKGPKRVSPFFIPGALINLVSGQVSIRFGFKGPNHAVVTACSTGAHAIGDAARMIAFDDADVMVAGGAESPISEIGIAGFNACKALSTKRADDPTKASRPYDADRDGFVMGEGAGVVVLEEYGHAVARGAKIYAEVLGYGMSGDAYHITAPSEDGDGAYRSMAAALKRAGLAPGDVDYINAHGTSTMADTIELGAVERLLGDAAASATMSSTKSSIGHLLGAAGAVEAIFCVLAIRDQIAPPTINLDNPALQSKLDLVPNVARKRKIDVALSNSFGFGGTNASLVLGRVK